MRRRAPSTATVAELHRKHEERDREALLSPYAVHKEAAAALRAGFQRHVGLEIVGLRYFNVFGPRQEPGWAVRGGCPTMGQRASSEGQTLPPFRCGQDQSRLLLRSERGTGESTGGLRRVDRNR